ncbi:MAG TPA: alpha/beta fold hydrolase [Blastocatellia bacterium]|nr:alpha/beta fold hydrolase [Blastocatellia bacterium]
MKNLVRALTISSILLVTASAASAQDGATRAEFDCLMLANSSSVAVPGEPSRFPAYHHVWMTGMQYGTFKSHGLSLTYETQGEGSEVILVVHGGPGMPHDFYHPMLSNLSRYAKLVYFDRRADMLAAGRSHEPASIEEMAEDIDALRQTLNLNRVSLLGQGFGGAIALEYALKYPANVKRLILVSASAVVEDPRESEKRIVKTLSPAELAVYRSGEGGTGAAQPCDRVRKRYSVLYPHYFYRMVPYEFNRGAYTAYFDSLAKKLALSTNSRALDLRSQLGDVTVPTIVFAGRHDLVTTMEQARDLANGLPKSKLVVMEQSAHFPIFEQNYLFTQWVRQFMARTSGVEDDGMSTRPLSRSSSAGK